MNWPSLVLSTIAVTTSAIAIVLATRRHKEATLMQLHTSLLTEDQQRARMVLHADPPLTFDVANAWFDQRNENDLWVQANRALATFDAVGLYALKGYVNKEVLLNLWAEPLARMSGPADQVIAVRKARTKFEPWPSLRALLDEAVALHPTIATRSAS